MAFAHQALQRRGRFEVCNLLGQFRPSWAHAVLIWRHRALGARRCPDFGLPRCDTLCRRCSRSKNHLLFAVEVSVAFRTIEFQDNSQKITRHSTLVGLILERSEAGGRLHVFAALNAWNQSTAHETKVSCIIKSRSFPPFPCLFHALGCETKNPQARCIILMIRSLVHRAPIEASSLRGIGLFNITRQSASRHSLSSGIRFHSYESWV
jgi:hypothetical protein